tara:strand:- start:60 stop:455 length:396 start_codon:yes stop_codon:yes gene_type:complete
VVSCKQQKEEKMSAIEKDDCKQQLRRMCKKIADDISEKAITRYNGWETDHDEDDEGTLATRFMDHVYDIEWIMHQDKTYKAARLLVAGGGPNIWVNLQRNVVQGYWWDDYYEHNFQDNIGLDQYLEEIYDC